MGLWELLDYACATLTEAGYPDVWDWTPRQILHRLEVHKRLKADRSILDLEIALLAARGDEKAVKAAYDQHRRMASPEPSGPGDPVRKGSPAVPVPRQAATDEDDLLKQVGWDK